MTKKVKMHPPSLGHSFLLIVTWVYHIGSICFTTRYYIEHLAYLILWFFQGLICALEVQVLTQTLSGMVRTLFLATLLDLSSWLCYLLHVETFKTNSTEMGLRKSIFEFHSTSLINLGKLVSSLRGTQNF